MKKRFYVELLNLILIVINITCVGLVTQILIQSFEWNCIILLLFLLFVNILWKKLLTKTEFGIKKLEPYRMEMKEEVDDCLAKMFDVGRLKKVSEELSYGFFKYKKIRYRVACLKIERITSEIFKKKKKTLNSIINKETSIMHCSSIVSMNKVRINIVIVNEFDDFCHDLASNNASLLFSRSEPILNVFVSKKEKLYLIPAHYGYGNFLKYKKTIDFLKKFMTMNCANGDVPDFARFD